jgi:hypothetical protein
MLYDYGYSHVPTLLFPLNFTVHDAIIYAAATATKGCSTSSQHALDNLTHEPNLQVRESLRHVRLPTACIILFQTKISYDAIE